MIALLVLAFTLQPDAGTTDAGTSVERLYASCPDAPLATVVDGGVLEPWARVERNNCKMSACESYANAKLAEDTPTNSGVVLGLIGGGVAAVILGVVVGYFIPHPKS